MTHLSYEDKIQTLSWSVVTQLLCLRDYWKIITDFVLPLSKILFVLKPVA